MSQVRTPADFPRLWRGLVRRVEELELAVRRPRQPTVVWGYSTGDTGALGGAWQLLPGLDIPVTLRKGQLVEMNAVVMLQGNGSGTEMDAFWRVGTPTAGEVWTDRVDGRFRDTYPGADVTTPVLASYVAAEAGTHWFRIYCTASIGSGGYGIGYQGRSAARLTIH